MKLIIAGSRDLTISQEQLKKIISYYYEPEKITEIVSGNCISGIDKVGETYALQNNLPLKLFPADWIEFGNAAGPKRNKLMANYADCALVIMREDNKTPGSLSMIKEMKKIHKRCETFEIIP